MELFHFPPKVTRVVTKIFIVTAACCHNSVEMELTSYKVGINVITDPF